MTVLMGHQPLFVGSSEWWARIATVDVFVVNDHVDYEPKSAQSRHRIDGSLWALPVVHAGRPLPIRDTPVAWNDPLVRKMERATLQMWPKQPYRTLAREMLMHVLARHDSERTLGQVTLGMMYVVHTFLGLTSKLLIGTDLNARCDDPLQRGTILGQCLVAGATEYWCGVSGREYLALREFNRADVAVIEVAYDGPDPDVPILDLIARHGPNAKEQIGRCVPARWLVRPDSWDAILPMRYWQIA